MAGFDFQIRSDKGTRPLARALLQALQTMRKGSGLTVRYAWKLHQYRCRVDGPLPEMQALIFPSVLYLKGLAEGFPKPPRRARRCLCQTLLDAYAEGVDEISDFVAKSGKMIGGVPSSYSFDVGDKTHLKGPVGSLTRALVMYHNGFLSPAAFSEAAHTGLEVLLKAAVPKQHRGYSFAELTKYAADAGFISASAVNHILELKELRVHAKHYGQGVNPDRMNAIQPIILESCHSLCRLIASGSKDFPLGALRINMD